MPRRSALVLLSLLAGMAVIAAAQRGPGRGSPMYDSKTEVTVSGTVAEVQNQGCMQNGVFKQVGMHLVVQSESEKTEVCVGPVTFVQKKGFSFAKGELIEVVGSKVKMAGKDVVIARQITKDKQTLTLRDAQGIPAWSGRRRAD